MLRALGRILGLRDNRSEPDRLSAAQLRAMNGRALRARYDSAQNTGAGRRHWSAADHLSADAAANPAVRRILRSRARYEYANSSYLRAQVRGFAMHVVGTGPRLQVGLEDATANREIEKKFARWAKAVRLVEHGL